MGQILQSRTMPRMLGDTTRIASWLRAARTGSRMRAASPAKPLAPANPSDTSPLERAALEMRPAFSSLAIISSRASACSTVTMI